MAKCGATIQYVGLPEFTCTLPAGHKVPAGNKAPHFNAEIGKLVRQRRTDPRGNDMAAVITDGTLGTMTAEQIAQAFHETYERLAPDFGYKTREASAKPWDQVPEQNRSLMVAVVQALLDARVILGVISGPLPPTVSDEDRIRGAMAEAQDHPGRIVSR